MKLNIIVTTDLHGNIFPTDYTSKDNVAGFGFARIATAIKKIKETNPTLLIDNGDAFQGSPLMTLALEKEIENPMSTVFNMLDYDFYNLGNHDFNYGSDVLLKFVKETKAHLLTSNIFYKDKPIGSSKVITIHDKRIAFIGITTHYIPNWEHPSHIKDFNFTDAYETLKKHIKELKDDVDLIIGVYHGGLEKDPKTGIPTENLTGENQGYKMSHLKDLDILITGHQHRTLIETIDNTLITQSGFKGQEFIHLEIDFDDNTIQAQQIETKNYKPDEAILNTFKSLQEETQIWLDQAVGSLESGDLLIHDEFEARLKKHPLISFINQVQLDKTQADIAGNALFNGAKGFKNKITYRDLVSTYVYPNTLVVKEMSGKQLKDMLEFSAYYFDVDEHNQIIVHKSYDYPKPQHYNYDMFDGISYTIKVSNPRDSRILDLKFKDKTIQDDDIFKVAVNNYRATGGGDYHMVLRAKTIQEIQEDMITTLANYFREHSPVKVNHHDNIKIIV